MNVSGNVQSESPPTNPLSCSDSSNIKTSAADVPSSEEATTSTTTEAENPVSKTHIVVSPAARTSPSGLVEDVHFNSSHSQQDEYRPEQKLVADLSLPGYSERLSGMCLNSSNKDMPLVLSNPGSLRSIVKSFLLDKQYIDVKEIEKNMSAFDKSAKRQSPLSLKELMTEYLQEHFPSVDLDDAQTAVLKHNILRKYEIKNQEAAPELDLNVLLKSLALKRKSEVIVPKVDKVTVNRWTKKVPHWSKLDPYSDLEDQGSSSKHCDSDSTDEPVNLDSGVHFTRIGGHVLRKQHWTYSNTHARRSGTEYTFYRDMCSTPKESSKPKKKKIIPRKEPSNARMESQTRIKNKIDQDNLNLIRSYPLFDSSAKNSADQESEPEPEPVSDSDTIPYVPEASQESKVSEESKQDVKPKKKRKLITKTYGIKNPTKNKSGRKYKCTDCVSTWNSVAELNWHFKDVHPPIQCKICKNFLNTPNTLARHMFSHRELKYPCDHCSKRFAFESDRNTHHISHRKIKTFVCNSPNCGKTFFFKGHLTKHVKTHQKIKWKCQHCKYVSKDERNLKAHQRLHSNLKSYICKNCLQLFKYNEQLKRHQARPKDCERYKELKSQWSESPEY